MAREQMGRRAAELIAAMTELQERRVAEILGALSETSGTISGHLVTDACYGPGGCGPDCPVWVGEAEDARGPN